MLELLKAHTPAGTWSDQLAKWVAIVGGTVVIAVTLGGAVSWWAGGLRLGTQVTSDELTGKVNSIEVTVGKIKDKIDSFPRASDFAAQSSFNDRVNGAIAALGDRMTADELKQARTDARVDGLYERTPAR